MSVSYPAWRQSTVHERRRRPDRSQPERHEFRLVQWKCSLMQLTRILPISGPVTVLNPEYQTEHSRSRGRQRRLLRHRGRFAPKPSLKPAGSARPSSDNGARLSGRGGPTRHPSRSKRGSCLKRCPPRRTHRSKTSQSGPVKVVGDGLPFDGQSVRVEVWSQVAPRIEHYRSDGPLDHEDWPCISRP